MPGAPDICAGAGPPAEGPGTGAAAAEASAAGGAPPGITTTRVPTLTQIEEVADVLIQHADAARRHELADCRGLIGAVNAIHGGAEIHGAGAKRVAGTASHEARQIGLPLDHLARREPVRPLRLLGDLLHAGPGETVAADANAVADRPSAAQHVIEIGVGRIDDDGTSRLLGNEGNFLPAQVRRKLRGTRLRLFLRRQRGNGQRPAIRAQSGLLPVDRSSHVAGSANRPGRPQTIIARIGAGWTVRIDHGRTGWAAITRVIGGKNRAGRHVAVGIDRSSAGRTSIARIIGREDRTSRHVAVGINRPAVTRIIRRHHRALRHRAGRRQRGRIRRFVVFRRIEIGNTWAAAAIVGRIGRGRRRINRPGRHRIALWIALLRLRKRDSCHARRCGSTNRQNVFDHHRSCIFPKPTPER